MKARATYLVKLLAVVCYVQPLISANTKFVVTFEETRTLLKMSM
jgi:hypothetical protein